MFLNVTPRGNIVFETNNDVTEFVFINLYILVMTDFNMIKIILKLMMNIYITSIFSNKSIRKNELIH